MALLPCDYGPHRNLGRNTLVYIGLGSRGFIERMSFRLCPRHWAEIEVSLHQFEVDPESGAISLATDQRSCVSCLQEVSELGRQLFVTSYPAKDQRKDYWSRIHDDCSLPPSWPKPEWGR